MEAADTFTTYRCVKLIFVSVLIPKYIESVCHLCNSMKIRVIKIKNRVDEISQNFFIIVPYF